MSTDPIFECEQVLRLILAYLDGEVGDDERRGVAEHLERCRSCFSRAEFERRLQEHLAELGREPVPATLLTRVRTMMRQFGP